MFCETIILFKLINPIFIHFSSQTGVHHTLQDLLPAKTYFRFNPYLSEEFFLDEIRQEKMDLMQHDAQMYARRNSYKVIAAAQRLVEKRKPQQRLGDWLRDAVEKIWSNSKSYVFEGALENLSHLEKIIFTIGSFLVKQFLVKMRL